MSRRSALVTLRRVGFRVEQVKLLGFRFHPRYAHGAIVPIDRAAR
jgi:hypothetical protein